MFINIEPHKQNELYQVIKTHDFETYLGFTTAYRGFEVPNLDNDVKMAVLKKLSVANWREVPTFLEFWKWIKKNHGTKLSIQICTHMFPRDEKTRQFMINCMRNNQNHEWWNHLRARVYKKWCSILTEMQAVYAVMSGSQDLGLNWKVAASAELDAVGIDFVLVNLDANQAIPVQIKKDSFHQQINHKQNNKENLSRYSITKKAHKVIEKQLGKNFVIEDALLLKYGLSKNGVDAYDYLGHFTNSFVYFKPMELVNTLQFVIKPLIASNVAQNEAVFQLAHS